jgi:catechol 2,3-dioxygenase-like lactoylglutathione lyase family enzyme
MIKLKRLNAVTLTVRDVERSLRWYQEKFGFEKLFDVYVISRSETQGPLN